MPSPTICAANGARSSGWANISKSTRPSARTSRTKSRNRLRYGLPVMDGFATSNGKQKRSLAMPEAYDPGNIFAKILRGEIPSHRVYEDDAVLVFMDVMPQGPGHTLVVPKAPSRNLLDADPATLGPLFVIVQKVVEAVRKAFGADGVTVLQFHEPASGQTVYHLHVHVIPRFDGIALKPHTGQMENPDVLAQNAEKIRAALTD